MYLACSPSMAEKGLDRRLDAFLKTKGMPTTIVHGAPDAELMRISQFARTLVSRIRSENPQAEIVFNATGGTKLMMLGFVDVFSDAANRVLYTDTRHRRIEYLPKRGQSSAAARAMKDVLDIPDYLKAQGFNYQRAVSDEPAWLQLADRRRDIVEYLAFNVQRLGKFIGALNGLASQALDERGERLKAPQQQFKDTLRGAWKEAIKRIADADLLKWDGDSRIEFSDVESARFLNGGWLEEYAWRVIREQQVFDVRMSVKGAWETGTGAKNEFDVLAAHGNQLLVIECKTLRHGRDETIEKDADILYKLDSLGRDARGLFGSSWLLVARPPTPEMLDRAKAQGIRILGPDEIPRVAGIVKAWMTG